ncbi:unnamed protein product [Rhizoctonia solani]|uniref:Uncharacterized protein n=1 Tax=Rhizoctonia solani TaxID=456999 RepID=A0A8H3HSF0_9AGAM|nr:unnamed protein product [Rhizoctonia solani]
MSSKPGNQPLVYDENLLAQAPEVTQGQRQEGYDADILNPSPPPSRTPAPSQPYRDHPDVESGSSAHDKHLAAGGYDHISQSAKKPFWKTPKGIIILAVLALAVLAAVVGGAVGGTVGKNKNNSSPQNTSDGAAGGSGNSPVSSSTAVSPTPASTAQSPGETTGGGGDTPGGGGSNQTSSTRLDGVSPTRTTSEPQRSSTPVAMTSPGVEPPAQSGAGDAA